MPSCGRPTVCSSTSGGSSTRVPVIDDDSVHAYRTTIGHPRRVRIFSARSGVTGAEPVDARRSDERSAWAELRQVDELAPLRRHALADGDALAHHRVEHRLDRPRRAGEHRVDDELDLVPELVHVARVRERHRHEAHVVVRAEDVAEAGRRLQRAVVEPRALGQTGGAAGPDDAHRVAGVATRTVGELGAGRPRCGDLGAGHQHLRGRARRAGPRRSSPSCSSATGSQRCRIAATSAGPSRVLMPVATAPSRRARGVGDRVVDARRQPERDDVAGRDATRPQLRRERVGTGQPFAVGEALRRRRRTRARRAPACRSPRRGRPAWC